MVNRNRNLPVYDIVFMAKLLSLDLERARFLAACSHDDTGRAKDGDSSDRGQNIPYDDGVLIREACRIGISLRDTARMMKMTREQVAAYGLKFRVRSKHKPQNNQGVHNLFQYEPPDPYRCRT